MEGRFRGGKRRRRMMGEGGEMEVEVPPRLKSVSMFEGHKDAVTGVAWASTRSLFTGSFDHNIVSWDVGDSTVFICLVVGVVGELERGCWDERLVGFEGCSL